LIDSLVLQSGYSNLRLESYLFTLESFKDVKRVLNPKTGVYAVYNFFRQGWIAARIRDQLRTAFDGVDPVVITCPSFDKVEFNDFQPGASTGFFAGSAEAVEPLRKAFEPKNGKKMQYWYPWHTGITHDTQARFATEPPPQPPPPSPDQSKFIKYLYKIGSDGKETKEPILDENGRHKTGPLLPEWIGLYPTEVQESKDVLYQATDNCRSFTPASRGFPA
jgi:hypothetical protein